MRDWADSCANIRACRYRLLPESSSGCSRCTSGIGNAPLPKGIHDVPNGESILRANLCARQGSIQHRVSDCFLCIADDFFAWRFMVLAESRSYHITSPQSPTPTDMCCGLSPTRWSDHPSFLWP